MEIKDTGYKYLDYLGDSVYAGFDGYHIRLMTWNGYPDDPRNEIALEPAVFEALIRYQKWMHEQLHLDHPIKEPT